MRVRLVAGALTFGCVLAACSTTTDGHPVAKPPSYLALTQIVLQPGDLPAGWAARPTQGAGADTDVQTQVATCVGIRTDPAKLINRAASPDFGSGEFTASSAASSFKTQAEVLNRLAAVRSPRAANCFTRALRNSLAKLLPSGTHVEKLTVRTVDGGAAANVAATLHAVVTVTALGQTARVYSDTAFISGVQFGVQVTFTGIGSQVPGDLQQQLTRDVAHRAARV
jgi:hypothetical protein